MERPNIDRRVAAFAVLHHGHFRVADLDALGVTRIQRRRRLESGRWIVRYDGVYAIAGLPTTWIGNLLAAVWAGGHDARAARRSAAALWEMPGARRDLREILCRRWRRTRETGLIVHESRRLDDEDLSEVRGVPVTSVERTLFDLAGCSSPTTLDLAIDNALRRQLTTFAQLEATLRRLGRRGRTGTPAFRLALSERSPEQALTESERERLVERMLQRHGLPALVPQYEIRDDDGNLVARADFAYPDLKISLEYDSYAHHIGKQELIRDSARRNAVVALGWAPITATDADLRTGGDQLAHQIRRARNRRLHELAS